MKQCAVGREPDDVPAWLFACVRNAAVDFARSEARRRGRERRAAREDVVRAALFDSQPGDALDAASAEMALAGLAPEHREVVLLRIWGNMTLAQTAAVTGSPISTVHDRYRSALEQLRQILETSDVKPHKRR
jgi:RNA polymerase sigma-70 factor (ECF subfamily)